MTDTGPHPGDEKVGQDSATGVLLYSLMEYNNNRNKSFPFCIFLFAKYIMHHI